ncbi:MAG: Gfo/Idh/MocA family oxidoreductase [Armatimonadota bacterium]
MAYKAAIVGCGGIAKFHADGYKAAGAEVIAVTDVCEEAATKFASDLGATVYPDFKTLIDQAKPDVVSICTPPAFHEQPAVYALKAGVNVICEKPMAHSVQSARAIKKAADESKALFMPAFRHRFVPANIKLKEMIAEDKIGDVVVFNNAFGGPMFEMESKWFTQKSIAGGGCLLDTSSHSVDLFRFIVGEIKNQNGAISRHFKSTDVEDAGMICVSTENGAMGNIQSGFVLGDWVAYIDISGTKGRMTFDYNAGPNVKYKPTGESEWTTIELPSSNGFNEEIDHFLGAMSGKHPLAITANDGLRCAEVIFSVYEQNS